MRYKDTRQRTGWEKATVRYALTHKTELMRIIGGVCRKSQHITSSETHDEIYQECLLKLASAADYDTELAKLYSTSETDIITLESYVGMIVKNCARVHIDKLYKDFCVALDSERRMESGDTISLSDMIGDPHTEWEFDMSLADLRAQLKLWECKRYLGGIDLFLFLYLGTQGFNSTQMQLAQSAFGITPKLVDRLHTELKNQQGSPALIKDLAAAGENAAEIIGERVYGKGVVDKVITYIRYNVR